MIKINSVHIRGRILPKYLLIGTLATGLSYLLCTPSRETTTQQIRDYDDIARTGVIRFTTEYNSIGYYQEQDTLAGFHYELMQAFARSHGLQAEIHTENSFHQQMEQLATGKADCMAYGVLTTSRLKESFLLTHSILLSKEVLIQRKPQTSTDSAHYIQNQLDLAEKTLYVAKGSPAILRIQNLANEIGDTIYIKEVEKQTPEQLMQQVAQGKIDYVVCDETLAQGADSLKLLDRHLAISFHQFYAWAVNRESPMLLDSLNQWLNDFLKSKEYRRIYHTYFHQSK